MKRNHSGRLAFYPVFVYFCVFVHGAFKMSVFWWKLTFRFISFSFLFPIAAALRKRAEWHFWRCICVTRTHCVQSLSAAHTTQRKVTRNKLSTRKYANHWIVWHCDQLDVYYRCSTCVCVRVCVCNEELHTRKSIWRDGLNAANYRVLNKTIHKRKLIPDSA